MASEDQYDWLGLSAYCLDRSYNRASPNPLLPQATPLSPGSPLRDPSLLPLEATCSEGNNNWSKLLHCTVFI